MESMTQNPLVKTLKDKDKILSYMIKYVKDELSPTLNLQIKELIQTCEDCRTLYEEVKIFFSEDDLFIFEVLNKKEIEESRKDFRLFANSYPSYLLPKSEGVKKEEENYNNIDDDICFSCGS